MRILHICSYYVTSNLYTKLFECLQKMIENIDVYVFISKDYKIENKYQSNVYISKCYNKFDKYIFHLKHSKVLNDIKNTMDIKKYDIIHAHSLFSNGYIAHKLKQQYNIPYIVAVRNTDVNVFFSRMIHLRTIGIDIMRNAEKVLFISNPYKEYTIERFVPEKLKKEIKEKSVVIPNGIDDFWLRNKHRNKSNPENKKIKLIYVGRIDVNKNIDTTTKACEILIKQGYEVNYKVIGNIKDKKYNDFIKKYPFIEYVPYCHKEELLKHYRASDIFVMPSKHETFGLVYVEAMSQGLPVIYTRGQGFDGHFKEGEIGYPVNYNSAKEIVERIKDILANYENISTRCVKNVDKFNWDEIAEEYYNIYKNIISLR